MSNLFGSLNNASQALSTLDRMVSVSQNNVNNASTAGFARQRLSVEARTFQVDNGLLGGVKAGSLESSRSLYAEGEVQRQSSALGYQSAKNVSLKAIEPIFDISGETGIPVAIRNLLNSFSAWSVSPNSADARQSVINSAGALAASFRQGGAQLQDAIRSTETQIWQNVSQINSLASTLRDLNVERRRLSETDAGLDARVQSTLEELSGLVDLSPVYQPDGTVTVLTAKQQPLVIGDQVNPLRVSAANTGSGLAKLSIVGADDLEVASQITGGSLGGLLAVRNEDLPSILGDAAHPGSLNRLAKQFADRVNEILAGSLAAAGQAGKPLFILDSDPAKASISIALNPDIKPSELAAIDVGPPVISNGAALKLSALNQSSDPADQLDGTSFTEYFAHLASDVGRKAANAESGQTQLRDLLDQVKALRNSLSGVSLDDEAVRLTEIQRSYQACARMVTVIDEITQTLLGMVG